MGIVLQLFHTSNVKLFDYTYKSNELKFSEVTFQIKVKCKHLTFIWGKWWLTML